jgi:hypothetical protein
MTLCAPSAGASSVMPPSSISAVTCHPLRSVRGKDGSSTVLQPGHNCTVVTDGSQSDDYIRVAVTLMHASFPPMTARPVLCMSANQKAAMLYDLRDSS